MLSIHKLTRDFKRHINTIPFDFFIAIIMSFVAFGSFALGWIAHSQQVNKPISSATIELSQNENQAVFVASQNSDVFHYRWCGGAQRINQENKVFFSSQDEARSAGYKPAANCPGL
jgi:hypothetical protein